MNIFNIQNETEFNHTCLDVFKLQYQTIAVYKDFVDALKVRPDSLRHYTQIPFLPISFFKTHQIIEDEAFADVVFSSSGTTGNIASKHYVQEVELYEQSYLKAFELFYGAIEDICVLALLPSYLEREGSSLIYMVEDLIKKSKHEKSGFFLHNHAELNETLTTLKAQNQKTILIGVTYALLDFVESYPTKFPNLMVMETGGMKGMRKEMVREELHEILTTGFGVSKIHSEYGMTELLSQAYSKGNGIFECPPWMKVLIRDTNDPLSLLKTGKSGGINIIDLANMHSCSFIATQDLGKTFENGSFEVLGRFDESDIRGCNLMVL
ncbi:MAG TPA: acyl transferase [Pelobium sp.]|nr:acyl transferase [Pelobium sp.]